MEASTLPAFLCSELETLIIRPSDDFLINGSKSSVSKKCPENILENDRFLFDKYSPEVFTMDFCSYNGNQYYCRNKRGVKQIMPSVSTLLRCPKHKQ